MLILSPGGLGHWKARPEVMSRQISSILYSSLIFLLQLVILNTDPIHNPPILILHLRLLTPSDLLKPKPIATFIIQCKLSERLDAVFLNLLVECLYNDGKYDKKRYILCGTYRLRMHTLPCFSLWIFWILVVMGFSEYLKLKVGFH